MESKDEVSTEEIKAFMNEPEEPEKPAPTPMGMDDWETTDPNGEPKKDFKLTTEDIACIAYHTVQTTDFRLGLLPLWLTWDDLEPHLKQHYIGLVNFFINSAANPNGHEAAQALHDIMLDAKLRDGWRYEEEYSETLKTDPTLLSYKGLPPHRKVRNFTFRCVVVGLLAVWKGH